MTECAALTGRQIQILTLAADGLTNAEIGRQLFISRSMVTKHLAVACEHLGARNRAHAVALALRAGLLTEIAAPDIEKIHAAGCEAGRRAVQGLFSGLVTPDAGDIIAGYVMDATLPPLMYELAQHADLSARA